MCVWFLASFVVVVVFLLCLRVECDGKGEVEGGVALVVAQGKG